MEYIKLFRNHSDYEDFTSGGTMMKPNVAHCVNENEVHYNPIPHDYKKDYFTIESLEDNNTIYWEATNSNIRKTISASTDNGQTWTAFTASYCDDDPMAECLPTKIATLNVGEKALIKGENSAYATSVAIYNYFSTNGQFEVKGNIMSLISGDSFANADELTIIHTFCSLFRGCTYLISAGNLVLPAITLSEYCYRNMFFGCTSLITPPKLLATKLEYQCCQSMFNGCSSLTTAPELPATTLAMNCYNSMFYGCTSLTVAPELPATTLASNCYGYMFQNCTNLTTAPELPVTTLTDSCYRSMFQGCTSLNYIKCLATDISASNCTTNWVIGVASSGTFVKNSTATWNVTGVDGIPTGWTVETALS